MNHNPHILIVAANFYPEITNELLMGSRAALDLMGASYDEIMVPGAFEIPPAINFALDSKKYDGFIALGCVIRGETTHYDYVCGESARGLMELALRKNACIGYGILTTENMEQALVRARVGQGNKGRDAADAAMRLIAIRNNLGNIK